MTTKTIPANFELDDLLAYLRKEDTQEGFLTTSDWATRFGISVRRMRIILAEAQKANRLEVSSTRQGRIDGVVTPVPAYAFILDDPGEDLSPSPSSEREGESGKN